MIKKGLIHVKYIKYALYRGFVSAFFCLSVCQLVHPFVLWLVLLLVLPLDMHCLGALSVRSFVCLSVGSSIGPLVGSPAGPSTGWMHHCLPVRLVSSSIGLSAFNAKLSVTNKTQRVANTKQRVAYTL